MYVLVVSQKIHCRNAVVEALVSRGYLAAGVSSPQEGVRLIRRLPPDVIIVWETTALRKRHVQTLRSFEALDDKPILLIGGEEPDDPWMDRWGVEQHISPLAREQTIVDEMSGWLVH
jgi:PleD family two-component response regulator